MKDANDHSVTFHHPSTLGTAMAERKHMPHSLNHETTGHAKREVRENTRTSLMTDSIREETGTDSP
jgi:hypothetical protein